MAAIKLLCVIIGFGLAFESCIVAHHPIPIGIYSRPFGEETVSARESQLHFHIRIDKDNPDSFVDRTYDYGVIKNHIALHSAVAATSAEAAFGFDRYQWDWDGNAIIRHDPRSGESVRFTQHVDPPTEPPTDLSVQTRSDPRVDQTWAGALGPVSVA